MRQKAAWFILGLLLGSFLMQTLVGREMNRLYYEQERLKIELYDTVERLKKFEDQSQSRSFNIVKDIKVEFFLRNEITRDAFTELELKKEIKEITKGLIGQEINRLNHEMVVSLLDNRIIKLGDKNFLLELKTLIITEQVVFYLEIEYLPETGADEM
ncbi:MAG: hypothetical protein CVU88_00795 [Firmicutes bacterium HGW-Firmicutes-13]|nr:MAG: hypothetical protein CVU88_00795 [Firmicutes bacterium HGW-Firmicutes-13]